MPRLIRRPFAFVLTAGLLGMGLPPAFAAQGGRVLLPELAPGTPSQDAGTLAPWQDQEFRTTYVSDVDETHMFLALQLVDPGVAETRVTAVFGARFRGRNPNVAPGEIEMRIALHPLFDPRQARIPRLTLFLNPDTEESEQLDFSGILATAGYFSNETRAIDAQGDTTGQIVGSFRTQQDPSGAGEGTLPNESGARAGLSPDELGGLSSSVDTMLFRLPVGLQLLRILNAENVEGTAVGVLDFAFTEAQLEAFRAFANRILLSSNSRTLRAATAQERRIVPPGRTFVPQP